MSGRPDNSVPSSSQAILRWRTVPFASADSIRSLVPVRSLPIIPSPVTLTRQSIAAAGLPPPAALAVATGMHPLAQLEPLLSRPAMSVAAAISFLVDSGPVAALNRVLASIPQNLEGPAGTAALVLASLTILLTAGSLGLAWIERAATKRLSHWFGWRSVLVTGWIGTPIHELSHLAACRILGLRIVDYRLFQPDPRTATLGYVHYVQEGSGVARALRRFVVGVAPLITGLAVLTVGWLWILGPESAAKIHLASHGRIDPMPLLEGLAATTILPLTRLGPGSWKLWLWAYFALTVGLHMSPSRTDLKNAAWGLLTAWILALLALFLTAMLLSPEKIAGAALPVLSILGSVLAWTTALALVYLGFVWIASRLAAR